MLPSTTLTATSGMGVALPHGVQTSSCTTSINLPPCWTSSSATPFTFCATHLPKAAVGRLGLARWAAQEKRTKYAQPDYNIHGYDFIPLAGEFGGGVCAEWTALIDTLAAHCLDTDAFRRSGRSPSEGKAHFVQW